MPFKNYMHRDFSNVPKLQMLALESDAFSSALHRYVSIRDLIFCRREEVIR